jgi:pyruvate dehydrogenase (quinone)/pyruvate oxidase
MKPIAAETLVTRLVDWGVDTVFGLPGDGINGLFEAFRRHADSIRLVIVQHEEAAAFMATAHAKMTGRLGVCLATSGPGGVHLLNGLYDAKLDNMPVLALTGMQETSLLGTGYQQEVHLEKLFTDVAEYDAMITNPQHVQALVDAAVRTSLARRTVSHLTFPNDIQVAPAELDPYEHVAPARVPRTGARFVPASGLPDRAALQQAATHLQAGTKTAILAGAGALGAGDELLRVAELLGAPIVKTLPGKAAVPDDSPYTTGGLGLLGTGPSERLMSEVDTLLMVGTNFPYTKHLPQPDQVTAVQIEADPTRAGARLPLAAAVVGDAKTCLTELAALLTRREDRSFLEQYQKEMQTWRLDMAALQDPKRTPIAPEYLISVIDEAASDDAVLTCDSGTIATWAARHWTIRGRREFYLSGNLATMAPGLPYANAAQLLDPDRQVIAFVGDGGFAMLMAELRTAALHGLHTKVFINNNGAFGQILWEQIALGFPEYETRHGTTPDFAPWAQACGLYAATVDDPADLPAAVEAALAHPGPALVDCRVNADEPPLPGKIEKKQAIGFMKAFTSGQPHKREIVKTLVEDTASKLRS